MILLTPAQRQQVAHVFQPEQAGWPVIGPHVLNTGCGFFCADRWPEPQAVIAGTMDNVYFAGLPGTLDPAEVGRRINGFIDGEAAFAAFLAEAYPEHTIWDRVLFELHQPPTAPDPPGADVRRLTDADAYHLWALSPDLHWIWNPWGGPQAFAASGYGWGAFVEGRLVAVAGTFFVGTVYEELGVVTDTAFRGRGLSSVCTARLCVDVQARGHTPAWSTTPDNVASIRVAEKLGFEQTGTGTLLVVGVT